jgi:hypothetical protein
MKERNLKMPIIGYLDDPVSPIERSQCTVHGTDVNQSCYLLGKEKLKGRRKYLDQSNRLIFFSLFCPNWTRMSKKYTFHKQMLQITKCWTSFLRQMRSSKHNLGPIIQGETQFVAQIQWDKNNFRLCSTSAQILFMKLILNFKVLILNI